MNRNLMLLLLVLLAAVLGAREAWADQINLYDADFDGGWTAGSGGVGLYTTGASASASIDQVNSGGNGGAYYKTTLSLLGTDQRSALAFNIYTEYTYDPSTSGALDTVDFAADFRLVDYGDTAGVDIQLALRQETAPGTYAYYSYRARLPGNNPPSSWTAMADLPHSGGTAPALSGIQADDFALFAGLSPASAGANPDFSTSGGALQFGYMLGKGSGPTSPSSPDKFGVYGIDNWSVTLNTTAVPEPGTLALAGLGIVVLLRQRRRRHMA